MTGVPRGVIPSLLYTINPETMMTRSLLGARLLRGRLLARPSHHGPVLAVADPQGPPSKKQRPSKTAAKREGEWQ